MNAHRSTRHATRFKIAVATAALEIAVVSVLAPSTVFAAGNAACTDLPGTHAYARRHVTKVVGAEVKIDRDAPLLCIGYQTHPPVGSFSYASAEIAFTGNAIIQVGYMKCYTPVYSFCNATNRYFYAWGRVAGQGTCTDTVGAQPRDLGPSTSGVHRFTVYRNTTQVVFQIDGTTMDTIPIGSVSCWTAKDMIASGETWDTGDQMGGVVGAHQHFTGAIYEANVGGAWLSSSFTTCVEDGVYQCSLPGGGGQSVDIWTDRGG